MNLRSEEGCTKQCDWVAEQIGHGLAQIDTTRRGRGGITTGSSSNSGGIVGGGEGLAQIATTRRGVRGRGNMDSSISAGNSSNSGGHPNGEGLAQID